MNTNTVVQADSTDLTDYEEK